MSYHSSGSCLCTGACMRGGKCAAYPNGKESGCYGTFSTSTSPTFAEIHNFKIQINTELEIVRQKVNAHEHTINHTQSGVEACFEAIEKVADYIGFSVKEKTNPFEFIAVDGKRRDDIRHIKNSLYELYKWILDNVQENKERSKGIERLEEAAMWLNKSISRRIDNESQRKAGNDR